MGVRLQPPGVGRQRSPYSGKIYRPLYLSSRPETRPAPSAPRRPRAARASSCASASRRSTRTAASRLPHQTSAQTSGLACDGGADAGLVDHHVHVLGVPQRGEDPPADAERRPPVVILLDRLGEGQRDRRGLRDGDHADTYWARTVAILARMHFCRAEPARAAGAGLPDREALDHAGSVSRCRSTRCGWPATSRPTAIPSPTTTRRRSATRRSGCAATAWPGSPAATRAGRSSTGTWPRKRSGLGASSSRCSASCCCAGRRRRVSSRAAASGWPAWLDGRCRGRARSC